MVKGKEGEEEVRGEENKSKRVGYNTRKRRCRRKVSECRIRITG